MNSGSLYHSVFSNYRTLNKLYSHNQCNNDVIVIPSKYHSCSLKRILKKLPFSPNWSQLQIHRFLDHRNPCILKPRTSRVTENCTRVPEPWDVLSPTCHPSYTCHTRALRGPSTAACEATAESSIQHLRKLCRPPPVGSASVSAGSYEASSVNTQQTFYKHITMI